MKLNVGLLIVTGSLALAACGDDKNGSAQNPVLGEPCSVEGQRSECAKDGFPNACVQCQGQWFVCQGGTWTSVHCDPMQRDAGAGTPDSSTSPGDTPLAPVAGGACSVEGQQSECAKDGYPAACLACWGSWLVCQSGKWLLVHCDPIVPVDAPVDTQSVDVPLDLPESDADSSS